MKPAARVSSDRRAYRRSRCLKPRTSGLEVPVKVFPKPEGWTSALNPSARFTRRFRQQPTWGKSSEVVTPCRVTAAPHIQPRQGGEHGTQPDLSNTPNLEDGDRPDSRWSFGGGQDNQIEQFAQAQLRLATLLEVGEQAHAEDDRQTKRLHEVSYRPSFVQVVRTAHFLPHPRVPNGQGFRLIGFLLNRGNACNAQSKFASHLPAGNAALAPLEDHVIAFCRAVHHGLLHGYWRSRA